MIFFGWISNMAPKEENIKIYDLDSILIFVPFLLYFQIFNYKWGVCLPDICTEQDVYGNLNFLLHNGNFKRFVMRIKDFV